MCTQDCFSAAVGCRQPGFRACVAEEWGVEWAYNADLEYASAMDVWTMHAWVCTSPIRN